MSAVRGYAEAAADLELDANWMEDDGHVSGARHCRVAAALLAGVAAALPPCPNVGEVMPDGHHYVVDSILYPPDTECKRSTRFVPCPDCPDGQVTVEQLAALWRAVHEANINSLFEDDREAGYVAAIRELRAVRP